MNKETIYMIYRLIELGISLEDAYALRRIAGTLHRWHERECGDGFGHIERDSATGKPRYYNDSARFLGANDVRRGRAIPDWESGALKRLNKIMAKYPDYIGYVQPDPRGAALYIVARAKIPDGQDIKSYYSYGVAVF